MTYTHAGTSIVTFAVIVLIVIYFVLQQLMFVGASLA